MRTSRGAALVATHRTAPRYTMVTLEGYPGVVEGGKSAIVGELYVVPAPLLRALDRFEEAPMCYRRVVIPTARGPAWMYLYRGATAHKELVPSGDWRRAAGFRASVPRLW